MEIKKNLGLALLSAALLASCSTKPEKTESFIDAEISNMVAQHTIQTDIIEKSGKILNPRTLDKNGNIHYVPIDDWTSGFFPGSMWLDYDLTKDEKWKKLAEKYTEALDSVKYLKWHHDVGFMIGCSYLTGYRVADKPEYVDVIVEAAKSLSTRFRPGAGVIQSWDADRGWQGKRGWECPVIIDNMMNLELLFEATKTELFAAVRQHRDTHTNQHGLAVRHGLSTDTQPATVTLTTRSILTRQKILLTSTSMTRTFLRTLSHTGTSMLLTFLTNQETHLLQHV